jgi:putative spermidine/putrescine transport system ATP-binding protein
MVGVRGVGKSFQGAPAVIDASFTLDRGRFLTILGPSGSGKTTLLRMIAGFVAPDAGEILINGVPVAARPPHRRSIGMVFQKLALFPHMTAEENVAFPLRMRRFDARLIPAKVEAALALVRLGGLGARRVHELSGGQQQRVAIARALVFEPDILLLDEPLAALDRKLREDMQLEFRRIQKELGVTTINVTHDQREALVMSDEVIVMDHGRIQQAATPLEAYRRPGNAFVAGFIGVSNFLAGRVTARAGDAIDFAFAGGTGRGVAAEGGGALAPGAPITAMLRAEALRIARPEEAPDGLDVRLHARIVDVIFEGDREVIEVLVETGKDGAGDAGAPPALRLFETRADRLGAHKVGERVAIGWRGEDCRVFAA